MLNITNMAESMPRSLAEKEAADFLEEEANQLARMEMNGMPHRAQIALSREIARLRLIARTLKTPEYNGPG